MDQRQLKLRASKIVQRVRVIAAKLDDLSSIPENHMVKESTDSHKSFSDHYTRAVAHVHLHRHRHNTRMNKSLNCEFKKKSKYFFFFLSFLKLDIYYLKKGRYRQT